MSRRELISVEKTTRKQIYSKPLDSPTVLDALAVFGKLCKSSYGPTGRLKFLQTALGGHVTVTSSCATILHHLISSCHPIVHLVMLAVKGHLDVYGDGGLATCILTTRLIETSIKLAIPRQLVVEVYAYALGIMTSYMVSEKHPWKMKLDVSDMKSMMCLLRSVLHTKPASCLTERDLNHMCTTLLKAFLHSLPSMSDAISHPLSPSPVQFLRCEGSAVIDSRVVDGVLLQAPSVLQPHHQLIQQPVKVALYNISMATDTEEWFSDVTTTTVDVSDSGLNTGILKQMIDVAMVLVSAGVGLVACQKCIHPTLKRFLKDRKVYVFDRLSVMHINAVQRLTGATLLSTFTTDIPEHWYGQLDSIEYTVIANKSYLHLIPTQPMTSVCTVILCSPDESSLEELLSTCQSAMSVLAQVVAYPWVVPGAGCMDTHLAGFLRTKALREKEEAAKNLGCTRAQFLDIITNIAKCLEFLASALEHDQGLHFLDSRSHHQWSVPPGTDPCTDLLSRGGRRQNMTPHTLKAPSTEHQVSMESYSRLISHDCITSHLMKVPSVMEQDSVKSDSNMVKRYDMTSQNDMVSHNSITSYKDAVLHNGMTSRLEAVSSHMPSDSVSMTPSVVLNQSKTSDGIGGVRSDDVPFSSCMCGLMSSRDADLVPLGSIQEAVQGLDVVWADLQNRTFDRQVIESLQVKVNSYKTAFNTTTAILRINHLLMD